MSDPQPTPPPAESPLDLRTVVSAFLSAFPEPTDEQLHKFSELLGIPYQDFENQVYRMFSEVVEDEGPDELADDEDIVEDDLDLFLVAFFAFVSSPNEEQVHKLAELIGEEPDVLEERVYKMLQNFEFSDELSEDDSDSQPPETV